MKIKCIFLKSKSPYRIGGGQRPTPTPSAPGFGAIFAIGSLLAVAYLVVRRRR